ncbi:ArnT family glycosyltransferase [Nitrospina watsonii]|uniref:PMT_2 domain-containing protein n=1 Tax=Nitrospina watsonii TaxID=1323948 RepID=A0ABN8W008_9BACT|nr:glycosyltransferase family 39 protein [Nitrospina watsonii]CAI2719375.1 putative PMT_2 domain-containing protein [Nitrospina watsonii]
MVSPARSIVLWFFPGPGLVILLFLFMVGASWQRWTDPVIDFGQQLYVPWALAEGQTLYKDIDFLHGPLSSYLHALIFFLFGPGLLHLALFNIGLIALTAILIHKLLTHFVPVSAARLGSLAFVGAFAFACHRGWAGLNFVTPYVYSLTHGVMLSLLALYLFVRFTQNPTARRLAGMGLVWGLVFLTKIEVFFALSIALAFGLIAFHYTKNFPRKQLLQNICIGVVSFFIPSICLVIYFSTQMPVAEVVTAILSPWTHAFNANIQKLNFYRSILGVASFGDSMQTLGIHLSVLLLTGYALSQLARLRIPDDRQRPFYQGAAVLAVAGGLFLARDFIPWLEITRSFPILLLLFLIVQARGLYKSVDRKSFVLRHLPLWTFTLFAVAMTFKVFFNLKMYHLGFALALPATLVILVLVFGNWLPRVDPVDVSRSFLQPVAYTVFLFAIGVYASLSYGHYQNKTFPVGQGPDVIYDYSPLGRDHTGKFISRGMVMQFALEWMEAEMKPGDTLLTLPDAMMFNYQLKRRFPTRDIIFNPLTVLLRGERAMLARLQASPPDYVALVHADHSHFGFRYFGKNYGTALYHWVLADFEEVKQIGPPPFTEAGFGIQIFKRKPS